MSDIQKLFIEKGKTLVLAESCTGGLIASLLTKKAGSSLYFLGSFVTYCDKMKIDILGVSKEVIEEKSAVSEEVVREMCRGALRIVKSDYAIAVSGDAGPGGERVGTVYGAIGNKEHVFVGKIPGLEGLERNEIQQKCADFLLTALYNFVKNKEVPLVNK